MRPNYSHFKATLAPFCAANGPQNDLLTSINKNAMLLNPQNSFRWDLTHDPQRWYQNPPVIDDAVVNYNTPSMTMTTGLSFDRLADNVDLYPGSPAWDTRIAPPTELLAQIGPRVFFSDQTLPRVIIVVCTIYIYINKFVI